MTDALASDDQPNPATRWHFWWVTISSALLVGVAAGLIALLVRANDDYHRSLGWQTQSLDVITLTKSVEASLARGESALARFAVGLDRQDGRVYQQQFGIARQYLRNLNRLVADNPRQLALVRRLETAVVARSTELGGAALSANYRQGLAAISKYYAAARQERRQDIDRLVDAVIANERQLLARRTALARRDRSDLNRVIVIFSLLGALIGVGGAVATALLLRARAERGLAERETYAENQRASSLSSAVEARTHELATANAALRHEMAEREVTEAQLRQAQKMEAVGELTGGIAHDFNNMLAVVVGGIELAQRSVAVDPVRTQRHLANALDGAARASDLTRRLLAFARAEPSRPEILAIDTCISEFVDLIGRSVGDRIAVSLQLGCGHAGVRIDRQQFENALLNLAVNARDAMAGKGTLVISTAARPCIGTHDMQLAMTITDTGCGMAPAVVERVFDPFFTTKPAGQGTGLGMSQVFAFVRQSGGEVHVVSEPGFGTSVTLALPMASADIATLPDVAVESAVASAAERSGCSILVVEDDPRVLTATVDAVTELGHRPIACADPFAAAALLVQHGQVDLILSDVLMPGLTGPEMVVALLEQWPGTAVLFVTGFAGEAGELPSFGDHPVLRKPFTLAALEHAIDDVITARAAV